MKFAKAFATDEENAAAVPLAVRFVTTTYQTGGSTGSPTGEEGSGADNEGGTE